MSADETWKVLDARELVDASPWLRVEVQTVQLPDGQIIDDYHRMHLPDFVIIVAETTNNEILLLHSYKHGVGDVCHTLPGGHIEAGETALATAQRELLEETGYGATEWVNLGRFVGHGNLRMNMGTFYLARGAQQITPPASGDLEDARVVLMKLNEAMELLRSGALPILHHATALSLAWPELCCASSMQPRRP